MKTEKINQALPQGHDTSELGDFTASVRIIPISLLAIVIGAVSTFVALALLRLIGLFTNLFYFQRWNTALVSPSTNHLGIYAVFVPIGGALIIGLMARYGSERIRGTVSPRRSNRSCSMEAVSSPGSRSSSRSLRRSPSAPEGRLARRDQSS